MRKQVSFGMRLQEYARGRQSGFSLIEIALVLVIVGFALSGILAALGPQLENKKVSDTQERMKQVSDAVMAYAMVHRRLPCPATTSSNGDEVVVGLLGQCANPNNGFVPARTLGLGERGPNGLTQDAWSFNLRYAVSQVPYNGATNYDALGCGPGAANTCYPLTQTNGIRNAFYDSTSTPRIQVTPTAAPFSLALATLEQLNICITASGITATTCGPAANKLASAAFLVWSTGRNGMLPAVAAGADETANLSNDRVYVFHPRTDDAMPLPLGPFDDLFLWQPIIAVISKMGSGGVLN